MVVSDYTKSYYYQLQRFGSFMPLLVFIYSSKVQKGKQGTKGAKQIVEENAATLKFYQYMAAGSTTIFFVMNFLFFEFTVTASVSPTKCLQSSYSKTIYIYAFRFYPPHTDDGIYFHFDNAWLISIHGIYVQAKA